MQVFEKSYNTCVPNYMHIYFPYNTVTSACQGSGLACTQTVSIFRTLTYMYADAFSSPKQTILHRYRNETNTKSIATQLFYQHTILVPRFMKSLCVITIQLNTLTDVYTKWCWVGHLFTYVKTCERGPVKDIHYNVLFFSSGPWRPRYNGVAV